MTVISFAVGSLATNCYLCFQSTNAIVIDPGAEARRIIDILTEKGLKLEAILLTHGHVDHIGAAAELKKQTKAPIYVHQADASFLVDSNLNLAAFLGWDNLSLQSDYWLEDGQSLSFSDLTLQVLHTPGHTPGSICFYCPDQGKLFSGDTLFAGGVGRTDLPGGDYRQLQASLGKILTSLPAETIVYPGHGGTTTIAAEQAGLGDFD
mgnify:CR=1 FL=1